MKEQFVKFYRIENINGVNVEVVDAYGIISEMHPGKYKPFIKYNQFGPVKKIPDDVGIVTVDPRTVEARFIGDRIFKSEVKPISEYPEYSGYEREVQIAYNYSIPYVVRFYPNAVIRIFEDAIYVIPDNLDGFGDLKTYTRLVKEYVAERVFVPGGYAYGNTVLLHLRKKSYVYIAETVYEFEAPEPITEYYSPVFANEVPYPVGITSTYTINFAELEYAKHAKHAKHDVEAVQKVKSLKGKHVHGTYQSGIIYRV